MVAVAPIIVMMVAVLAILVYYGAEWLGKVIINWTPDVHIPAVGSLRDLARVVVDSAIDLVRAILRPVVHPMVAFIEGVAVWIARIIGGLVDLAHQAALALHEVRAVIIPRVAANLRDYAERLVAAAITALGTRIHELRDWTVARLGDLRAWATAAIAAAVSLLGARIHQLRADVFAALGDLRSWVRGLVAASVAVVAAEVDQLRSWAVNRFAGVEADIASAVAGVETDIAKGVRTAEHYADAAVTAGVAEVEHGLDVAVSSAIAIGSDLITDDLPDLLGVIATDFPDLRALLGELDLSKLTDLAGVLGSEMVMARVLARYLEQCGIPNCRNLGALGWFLHALLDAGSLAALLALLQDIISDPENAAADVVSALEGPFTMAQNLAQDLLGV